MGSANERHRYNATLHLMGWAHTQKDTCMYTDTHSVIGSIENGDIKSLLLEDA